MPAGDSFVDSGVLTAVMSGMAGEFGAAAAMRTRRMDQLAEDASSMWAAALTTPTISSALGFRVASEAGSSRTRAETNAPDATAAQKG